MRAPAREPRRPSSESFSGPELKLAQFFANLANSNRGQQSKGTEMATTQKKANPVSDFTEKAATNGKKASAAYLDSYEKTVLTLADSYEKAAASTKVDWLETVASAQAGFAREVTKAYTAAARDVVA